MLAIRLCLAYLSVLLIGVNSLPQHVLQTNPNAFVNDDDDDPFRPPKHRYTDPETASEVARMLVSNNTHAIISTKYEIGNETTTMALPEYAIDCLENGDPILLLIKMSHTYRNIAKYEGFDSSITYTVEDGSNSDEWPGATRGSMYGLPRVSLRGHFRELVVEEESEKGAQSDGPLPVRYISREELSAIEQCFLAAHHESGSWFPGENHVHSSVWTEFVVDGGYFVGGFGGYAYIGELDSGEYHG